MDQSPDKISEAEARDALIRSGYLLENRLDSVLSEHEYYVEANSPYPDPSTGKSRELDIHALRGFEAGPEERDFVFANVLIECVNNPQPVAFITKEPLLSSFHVQEVKMAGLPVKVRKEKSGEWMRLSDYLTMSDFHHYCQGRVATQYCSFKRKEKKTPWMAWHEESHYDIFRTLGIVVNHHIREHFDSWFHRETENINLGLYYPIVVFQGDVWEVRQDTEPLTIASVDHIRFRLSSFTLERQDYQIDIVTEKFVPQLLRIIDEEVSRICRLLRRRKKEVRSSIDEIVQRLQEAKTAEQRRKVFEL